MERLHVFQRSAPWVVPRRDRDLTPVERQVLRTLPPAQLLRRAVTYARRELLVPGLRGNPRLLALMAGAAQRHLAAQVPDPALRARLTPDYAIGCKRILLSDDYYPALSRPQVELVTTPLREVRPASVVTADGVERPVDTIVFGTGFRVTDLPVAHRLRGRDGRLLADVWAGSPQAYLGTTVSGFPNLFLLVGPNTGLGHNSMVYMIGSQVAYALDALRVMDRRGVTAVDVRPERQEAHNRQVQAEMAGTVWTAGGCASWYLDPSGRNTTLWPSYTWRFRRSTRRFRLADYAVRYAGPAEAPDEAPVPSWMGAGRA